MPVLSEWDISELMDQPAGFARSLRGWFLLGLGLGAAAGVRGADGGIAVQTVMVPMRDGVRLATNVYRPAGAGIPVRGKYPAILRRTPYNKDSGAAAFAAEFVPYGYILVVQDVRGRYHSEGTWDPIRHDPLDGYDTAAWIGAQPWSNRRIGTIGSSYEGATQHALAIAGAPYVQAMIPRNAMSDFGLFGVRHQGAFELRWMNWVFSLGCPNGSADPEAALRAADPTEAAPALIALDAAVRTYASRLPFRAGTSPLRFAPDYERWLVAAMGHGNYDRYWKDSGSSVVDHLPEYKDIPVYHVTGWYDSWGASVANLNFASLHRAKRSLQRLLIGPWIHSQENSAAAGEAQFTPDTALDLGAFQRRWMDRWLKDQPNGVDQEPPVRLYVMGGGDAHRTPKGRVFVGGRWRNEAEWPLARTAFTPFYLHPGGLLSPELPSESAAPTTFLFDPRHPVPTLGGNISSQGTLMAQGAADQRGHAGYWLTPDTLPLSARNDILVHVTPPLAQPVEVTGPLTVTLWASSDGIDTDFTVKLVDVYPPNRDLPAGVELNVGDGIVRARYRHNLDHPEFLTPGQPTEFRIEMYPTSLLFARGHRIRLDVSSSNFPRFDVNPNTGEPLNDNRRWRIAANTVYSDRRHPSAVILPIIPR